MHEKVERILDPYVQEATLMRTKAGNSLDNANSVKIVAGSLRR